MKFSDLLKTEITETGTYSLTITGTRHNEGLSKAGKGYSFLNIEVVSDDDQASELSFNLGNRVGRKILKQFLSVVNPDADSPEDLEGSAFTADFSITSEGFEVWSNFEA